MEAIENKNEEQAIDIDDLRLAAVELDEAAQAIQFIVDEIDSSTRDVQKHNIPVMTKVFIDGELTQYVNMLQVILRDLSRNVNIILDGTEC